MLYQNTLHLQYPYIEVRTYPTANLNMHYSQSNDLDSALQYLLNPDNKLDVCAGADSYMNAAKRELITDKSAYILQYLSQEE